MEDVTEEAAPDPNETVEDADAFTEQPQVENEEPQEEAQEEEQEEQPQVQEPGEEDDIKNIGNVEEDSLFPDAKTDEKYVP